MTRRYMAGLIVLCVALGCTQSCRAEDVLIHETATHWEMVGDATDRRGKSVVGADVLAEGLKDAFRQETVTDARGEFRLRIPHSVPVVKIRVQVKGGTLRAYQLVSRMHNPQRFEPLPFQMHPVGEAVVLVVDPVGRPVEGATVKVTESAFTLTEGLTKKDGMVRVELMPHAYRSSGSIQAFKAGVGYDYRGRWANGGRVSMQELFSQTEKLTLNKTRTVRVKAIDKDKKPLSGLDLELSMIKTRGNRSAVALDAMPQKISKTNEAGIAEFPWVPAELDGPVQVTCHSENFSCVGNEKVTVQEGVEEYPVRFAPKMRLAGRVLLPDGKPAAKAKVSIRSIGVPRYDNDQILETSEEGWFEKLLPPDRVCLIFAEMGNLVAQKTGLLLLEGKPVNEVELRLMPGRVITGRCSRGESNQPASGETVQLALKGELLPREILKPGTGLTPLLQTQGFEWITQADANGVYRFTVPPGEYIVRQVFSPNESVPVSVRDDGEKVVDFHTPGERISFAGNVVDPDGKPVVDARIEKFYPSIRMTRERPKIIFTGADGEFKEMRINVPTVVLIRSLDNKLGLVTPEKTEETRRYELQPLATIRGRIVDSEGRPKKKLGVRYACRVQEGREKMSLTRLDDVCRTDDEGRFEARGLVVGADWEFSYEIKPNSYLHFRDVSLIEAGDLDLGETTTRDP